MKISKLHIDQFRHLENLDFDFTYPEDFHDKSKRGKPLDKICFIGQSATGKTSLLDLIDIKTFNNSFIDYPSEFTNQSSLSKVQSDLYVFFEDNKIEFIIKKNEILINYNLVDSDISNDNTKKIYFPSELNIYDIIQFLNPEIISNIESTLSISKYNQFKLNDKNYKEIFSYLLNDFIKYREKLIKKASSLLGSELKDIRLFLKELDKWKSENPNPNEEFAKEFNSVLKNLNLEVDTTNTDLFICLKHLNKNNIIPIYSLSTGTKLLISLLLPIYKFNTENSIILIDEPERSLYPDMQMDLMEHFQRLAPKSQFVIATHSPFIASSFEPEERFILYFGDDGKVKVRRGKSPIGDDPNDILKNDFDLEFLMNKKGLEAFERYRNLKKQIANENDETIKDNLLTEILELANAYKF